MCHRDKVCHRDKEQLTYFGLSIDIRVIGLGRRASFSAHLNHLAYGYERDKCTRQTLPRASFPESHHLTLEFLMCGICKTLSRA